MHGKPESESCSLEIPEPLDILAIFINESLSHSPLNSGNLKLGTLRTLLLLSVAIVVNLHDYRLNYCSASLFVVPKRTASVVQFLYVTLLLSAYKSYI